jgi:hypothetical protein
MQKFWFLQLLVTSLLFFTQTVVLSKASSTTSIGVTDRKIVDVNLKYLSSFEFLFECAVPKIYNGQIYLINYNKHSIDKLDQNGNLLQSFGRKGKGPGEFYHIDNFDVNSSGVSIIDNSNSTITEFHHNGTIQSHYTHDQKIGHGLRISNKYYLLKIDGAFGSASEEEFQVVNIDNKSKQNVRIQRLSGAIYDEYTRDFVSDGLFMSNQKGQVIRVANRYSLFTCFNNQGRFQYSKRTIDLSEIPQIKSYTSKSGASSKNIFISFDNIRKINIAFTLSEQKLLILSNAASPFIKDKAPNVTDERIVDVYNIANGEYLYSFQLPKFKEKRATDLFIDNNILYVCHGQYLCKYALKLL